MHRIASIVLCLAAAVATAAAQTVPADRDRIRDEVRAALRDLSAAADRGDVDAVMKRVWTGTPDAKRMAEPAARVAVAGAAVRMEAIERFGPEMAMQSIGGAATIGPPEPMLTDLFDVVVDPADPNVARLKMPGMDEDEFQTGQPLRRAGGVWQLDPSPDPDGPFAPDQADTIALAMAEALETIIPQMTAEAVADAESPMDWAASMAFGSLMGAQELDAPAALERLRKVQADRQPARAARAAKLAPTLVQKPIAVPKDDRVDRGDPLAVAKAYAMAAAAGDAERAASYVARADDGALSIATARAVARVAVATHRARDAAVARIGRAEALRLPWNDAGTLFVERFRLTDAEASGDGSLREVEWLDDFPTDANPNGTPRTLEMQRIAGLWGVATSDPLANAFERYGELQGLRSWAAGQEALAGQIVSGELATFDAINGRE